MSASLSRESSDETEDNFSQELLLPETGIDSLARLLLAELGHFGLMAASLDWEDLSEGNREAMRAIVERLLQAWPTVLRGHDELSGHR